MNIRRSSQPWSHESNSKSAGLLISILVRYPELASVNFDPRRRVITFTFLVRDFINELKICEVVDSLRLSLDVLSGLEDKEPEHIAHNHVCFGPVTAIEVVRDVATLSQEEISVMTSIMGDWFGELLVSDHVSGGSPDEELAIQEELISQMLEDLKGARQERDLIAVREEGRVMVFNK